jgi:hypothetical protein
MSACLYSCRSHPARKSHLFCAVLYCDLWPVWLYHIFLHYLTNGKTFEKKMFLNILVKCVLIFSTTFV